MKLESSKTAPTVGVMAGKVHSANLAMIPLSTNSLLRNLYLILHLLCIMQNGRRCQILNEGDYWGPLDEKRFESMETVQLAQLVLDGVEEKCSAPLLQERATHF